MRVLRVAISLLLAATLACPNSPLIESHDICDGRVCDAAGFADAPAADGAAPDGQADDTTPGDAGVAQDMSAADARRSDLSTLDTATLDSAAPDTSIPVDAARPDFGGSCPALIDRIQVTETDLSPDRIDLTNGDYFAPAKPVLLSTHAAGASVAWADSSDTVHVNVLSADDRAVGAHHTLSGRAVRGLVAHADGHGLLVRGADARDDQMFLVRLDASGGVVFDLTIVGDNTHEEAGDKWIDTWSHEGRLAWSGDTYGAYFGHTGNHGANGNHQGDFLGYYDAQGNQTSGGWGWGCSHSVDLRLQHNGNRFGPVCLSDCYPGLGFYFNHNSLVFNEPTGDCRGATDGRLGGLVPTTDGFLLSFAAPEGRASRDVALVHISDSVDVGTPIWLTDSAGVDESAPHLARLGDQLLLGWKEGGDHVLAVVDEAGTFLEGPVTVPVRFAALDDFVTFSNGDAGWAYAWDDLSLLKVVRVIPCG